MSAAVSPSSHVVFIHGLWMTGLEMSLLRQRVSHAGLATHQFFYPTVFRDLDAAKSRLSEYLKKILSKHSITELHFVCHSMGGLLLRYLLSSEDLDIPGKIVTIGTPHQGSLVANRFANNPVGHFFLGAAARHAFIESQLLKQLAHHDPAAQRACLTINGTMSFGLGRFITRINEDNDGTVLVSETLWPTEAEQQPSSYPLTHFSLLFSRQVADEVNAFLLPDSVVECH